MVALVNYMSQILVELIKLANLIININKSIACGNRIQAIFELQPSITDHAVTPVAEEKQNTVERCRKWYFPMWA